MTSSTKRACLAQNMNVQETAYLNALTKVAAYEVSGDRLMVAVSSNRLVRTAGGSCRIATA